MKYSLGKNTTRNLESILQSGKTASTILVQAVSDFINDTPIDFGIIKNGGYRTTTDQQSLYEIGVSKCDGVNNKSYHQSGLAVDLVPWVSNKYTWDKIHCFYLAGAFMSYCNRMDIPVTSGADWDNNGDLKDGWDPCHFQIKDI